MSLLVPLRDRNALRCSCEGVFVERLVTVLVCLLVRAGTCSASTPDRGSGRTCSSERPAEQRLDSNIVTTSKIPSVCRSAHRPILTCFGSELVERKIQTNVGFVRLSVSVKTCLLGCLLSDVHWCLLGSFAHVFVLRLMLLLSA